MATKRTTLPKKLRSEPGAVPTLAQELLSRGCGAIARNEALRLANKRKEAPLPDDYEPPYTGNDLERLREWQEVLGAVSSLARGEQETVLLRYWSDKTDAQIALMLGFQLGPSGFIVSLPGLRCGKRIAARCGRSSGRPKAGHLTHRSAAGRAGLGTTRSGERYCRSRQMEAARSGRLALNTHARNASRRSSSIWPTPGTGCRGSTR